MSKTNQMPVTPGWSAINSGLEDLIAHEQGIVFQRLCIALAKQRWPSLVATEIKKDGGEDAMSVGEFAHDKEQFRVACSLTGTLAKIRKDAQRIRQRGVVLDHLIFYAANKVTNTTIDEWRPKIQEEFGHGLTVISREDIIQELLKPQCSWIVSTHLIRRNDQTESSDWDRITFGAPRGLGPAIMGRSLGPSDAASCPTLDEIETVLRQLGVAYSARISGAPGVGKSVCAYQVRYALSQDGRAMYRLRQSHSGTPEFEQPTGGDPAIYLVDDAHLLPPSALQALEERADQSRYVVSTFNETQAGSDQHHIISIDAKQAVQTIASGLRAKPVETLAAVRLLDHSVGEDYGDIQLSDRIDEAAAKSDYPWQFCFNLGGGWRRADQAAKRVHHAGHHHILTAIAFRQLASRDAPLAVNQLAELCSAIDVPTESVIEAIDWLAENRLVLSREDLRCPHQRFATVMLNKIFGRLPNDVSRDAFATLFRVVVSNPQMPIAGIFVLLDELSFGDALRWHLRPLLDSETRELVLERCWRAESPADRSSAALVLTAVERYVDGWPRDLLSPKIPLLVDWISQARSSDAYGLGRLTNDVWNEDQALCKEIVAGVPPDNVARNVSSATVDTFGAVASLIDRLSLAATPEWKAEFREALDRRALLKSVTDWPDVGRLFVLARLCYAISDYDEAFSLDLVEAALPLLQRQFQVDPVRTFEQLDSLLGRHLRVWDPLGVYVGKLRPSGRKKTIARRLFQAIEDSDLAAAISSLSPRAREPGARMLSVLRELCPRLFDNMSQQIDWPSLEATIGRDWSNLSRGSVVLLCQLSIEGAGRTAVPEILQRNAETIERLESRLAIVSPATAFRVVEKGGQVALSGNMSFDWAIVVYVTYLFNEQRPDLLSALLAPHEQAAADSLTRDQPNTYRDVDTFLQVLKEHVPMSLDSILAKIDPAKAHVAWQSCLRDREKPRRAAAMLVQLSIEYGGHLASVGGELRRRFPAASVPSTTATEG